MKKVVRRSGLVALPSKKVRVKGSEAVLHFSLWLPEQQRIKQPNDGERGGNYGKIYQQHCGGKRGFGFLKKFFVFSEHFIFLLARRAAELLCFETRRFPIYRFPWSSLA